MIPLRDNIPSRTTPFVNYALVAACALVFVLQLQGGESSTMVEQYGMIPARVVHPDKPVEMVRRIPVDTPSGVQYAEVKQVAPASPLPPWLTLLTCVFLHGGWMHFIGNMWILYIFGDNVEDCLGHLGYLLFYLFCGIAASAAHLIVGPESAVPTIGASGAIAGVMGAYFVLYPNAKVLSLIPLFVFIELIVLPAPVFLGIWFAIQFFQGAMSITSVESTGVAWWAHIGGFAAGLAIAWTLEKTKHAKPPVQERRLDSSYGSRGSIQAPRRTDFD